MSKGVCVLKAKDQDKRLEALCAVLQKEAVIPAQEEAERLLVQAREESARLVNLARKDAESIIESAQKKARAIQEECDQQLRFAARQTEEKLKGLLEEQLFRPELTAILKKGFSAKGGEALLRVVAASIDQMGLDRAVILELPEGFEMGSVLQELLKSVMGRSKSRMLDCEGKSLRCHFRNEGWVLDLSPESLSALFWPMLRKELREKLFQSVRD
ncbi:hypothetical protein [Candidatus Similichlamydia laticola]|uniref:V-type ATP synthase subunit E n=1 Tax=Candidatus Similichlamydia laticola TaxID=2170265 RepID=A0A369KIX3_9BACT|nr:hypothetical protein [Candidatus Similichlamydia laticola]RDB31714.1 V-type ATP synthase subunit E [Candidatus Similichlamydia laticola]